MIAMLTLNKMIIHTVRTCSAKPGWSGWLQSPLLLYNVLFFSSAKLAKFIDILHVSIQEAFKPIYKLSSKTHFRIAVECWRTLTFEFGDLPPWTKSFPSSKRYIRLCPLDVTPCCSLITNWRGSCQTKCGKTKIFITSKLLYHKLEIFQSLISARM